MFQLVNCIKIESGDNINMFLYTSLVG